MSDEVSTGLSSEELWKKYGEKIKETVKKMLAPKATVEESMLLEFLSGDVGLPVSDLGPLMEKLAGTLLEPAAPGFWRRLPDVGEEVGEVKLGASDVYRRHSQRTYWQVAGLPPGPYKTKAEIGHEMNRYMEFTKTKDGVALYCSNLRKINSAIRFGIVLESK
ncbi:MAG: hypothetical protein ACRD1Z_04420, partial [Vicinamibacteria bacterium]